MASRSSASVAGLERSAPVRVVLVDDVGALRALYRSILEEKGPFEVVGEAADGQEAIETVDEHAPDLVLLDLSMPGMDGLEALPRIKDKVPGADVVILSGFLEERLGRKARELGASGYIEKGDKPEELVGKIVEILDFDVPREQQGSGARNGALPSTTPSDEELSAFAYAASHDLQEPLRMVRSYLSLLEERYQQKLDADGAEMIRYASEGAERMQEMIDALLAYARIETRGDPMQPVDLDDVLDDALANLSLRIEETRAEIDRDPLPDVTADPAQLTELLQNLVGNAIQYAEDRPCIRVRAEDRGDVVGLRVEDDGPGIPPEEQDRIFSMFQRGSTAGEVDGSGMGLAICKRIAERHGGSIHVDSTPGEGTTFDVRLPKQPPEDPEGDPA